MSERERWIVYPLLFLALGAALRDKMFDRTWSRVVVCEELSVIDSSRGSPSAPPIVAHLERVENAGRQPSGRLSIDEIRVGTVIADRYAYGRARVEPAANFMQKFWQALQAQQQLGAQPDSADAEQENAPNEPQPPE